MPQRVHSHVRVRLRLSTKGLDVSHVPACALLAAMPCYASRKRSKALPSRQTAPDAHARTHTGLRDYTYTKGTGDRGQGTEAQHSKGNGGVHSQILPVPRELTTSYRMWLHRTRRFTVLRIVCNMSRPQLPLGLQDQTPLHAPAIPHAGDGRFTAAVR